MANGSVFSTRIELNNVDGTLKSLKDLGDVFGEAGKIGKETSQFLNKFLNDLESNAKNAATALKNMKAPKSLQEAFERQLSHNNLKKVNNQVDELRKTFKKIESQGSLKKIFDWWVKISKKIKDALSLSRLFFMTQLAGSAKRAVESALSFGAGVNSDAVAAGASNTSVRNLRAFEFAADMWGASMDKSTLVEFTQALGDASKQDAFAALGLNSESLKKKDGANALMETLSSIDKAVKGFGGYDNMGAKAALQPMVEKLGLQWDQIKGLSNSGHLAGMTSEYNRRKGEDNRSYSAFGAFEREWKRFSQSVTDLWENVMTLILPTLNATIGELKKFFKNSKGLAQTKFVDTIKRTLNGIVKWVQEGGLEKMINAIDKVFGWLPKLATAFGYLFDFIGWLIENIGQLIEWIKKFVQNPGQVLKETMMDAVGGVGNLASSAWESTKNGVKNLWPWGKKTEVTVENHTDGTYVNTTVTSNDGQLMQQAVNGAK